MNALIPLQQWFQRNAAWAGGLAAPMLVITVLSMMVLPLAPWMLDTFFTLNIALALVVMMVAAYMKRPLDFSVFPTVLLLTTLLRLSLNVASTRVVLLEGHTGPGAAGAVAAATSASASCRRSFSSSTLPWRKLHTCTAVRRIVRWAVSLVSR